jgi:hypothetical protein
MATRYGLSIEQWNTAKEEIRQVLMSRAKLRGMIPYSELVAQIHSVNLEPDSYALAHILGEISKDITGRGMLSVIVVHKDGNMQPGKGFFELARQLGRDTDDILTCWVNELKRVHAYWSKST